MEKRMYARVSVEFPGTLYINGFEIPVTVHNISENGVGLRYKYTDCPPNFEIKEKDRICLVFYDTEECRLINESQKSQMCEFDVIQLRKHNHHAYIGAQNCIINNEYTQYVEKKKAEKFIYSAKMINFERNRP